MSEYAEGDLWEITVTDPEFTRVVGSTLCRVAFNEGYQCWVREDDGQFWLDINDSAIDSKRLIYIPRRHPMIRISIVGATGVLTYVELPGYRLADFYSLGLRLEVVETSSS